MPKQDHISRTRIRKAHRLLASGRIEEACKLCERLCAQPGAEAATWSLLGDIYTRLGRPADAVNCMQRVVAIDPSNPGACRALGDAFLQQGQPEKAADYYGRATASSPGDPRLLTNYAAILMGLNRNSEAEPLLRKAISLDRRLPHPYTNLGSCLRAQGKVEEALACYERGLETAADDPVLHSNYLLARHYLPVKDPLSGLAAHRDWASRHARNPAAHHDRDASGRDGGRKLRIGYVSPDFRTHSVAYFLGALFNNHDRERFEIFCYADVHKPDAMTQSLAGRVDHWRDTARLGDTEFVRCVRADRIDILVDLAGHTAGNRLAAFACRPAPVQISWLGYPDTTGLDAMDYRLSDPRADPAGFEDYYSEKLLRLKECFLCYSPPEDAPDPAPAPVSVNGFVTFGSFNNLSKINEEVVRAWSAILRRIPDARLLIKNPGLTDRAARESYCSAFRRHGVDGERIELMGQSPTTRAHLACYGMIDIGLDTFPYNGTTTTCEALWMGVPVLTVTGGIHAGCVGSSLLTAAGLENWIAASTAEYEDSAVRYAGDAGVLARLRTSLRDRMAASVLCDGSRFALDVEAAYRAAWQAWCAGQ